MSFQLFANPAAIAKAQPTVISTMQDAGDNGGTNTITRETQSESEAESDTDAYDMIKPGNRTASKRETKHTSEGVAVTVKSRSTQERDSDDDEGDTEGGEDGMRSASTFSELGLGEWIQAQTQEMGMLRPTYIQTQCIPPTLKGKNVIGLAKTGSGKTAAFALPILQHLSKDPYGVHSVVLTPTRELAFQISEQFTALGHASNVRAVVVVGGLDMMRQALELARRPHVVIATPGRLADHLLSNSDISIKKIKFLVLDEADRLLSETFRAHLDIILRYTPPPTKRQTLLFSATMHENMGKDHLEFVGCFNPLRFEAQSSERTISTLEQKYVFVPSQVKDCYLFEFLEKYEDTTAIIFAATCLGCETLAVMLRELGYSCVSLHSKMSQGRRLASLGKFRGSLVKILVATDVASRGLDIPEVEIVYNYDVPANPDDYIHRVGRTARAGRGGLSITIITQHDIERIQRIEDRTQRKMELVETEEDEVLKRLNNVTKARRAAILELDDRDFGERERNNKEKSRKRKEADMNATQSNKKKHAQS
ncbi:hypothetical protein SARC_05251 [Sphaeroforma arctica JP610]|uniref:Uncharacterized protein n=1 Tax=Sphaeroforma arctica JP610 TaxID=667725 RepID=A0A0L0G0T5_9EUKA|nr:hypothetical protein SARC_05251 [Sphaeroforma arctica JP610]KNC82459.1 hypothetical protein SARC_05251 [Sphaeroforma arctica JP610]|eukprot:XP_014156361.1 hypothetical protein SARC_05251 [Sphaeroforma arctica JP610]